MSGIIQLMLRLWRITWRVVLLLVLWAILLAPAVLVVAEPLRRADPGGAVLIQVYSDTVALVTLLLATAVMLRLVEHRRLSSIGFSSSRLSSQLLSGLMLGGVWLALAVTPLLLAGWASFQPPRELSWRVFLGTTVALVCNTITQELLVRGYIFQTLREHAGTFAAVLTSSLLFVALHAGAFHGQWVAGLNVFFAGVLFALAYLMNSSLWLPIGVHFAWNFLLGPVLGGTVSGTERIAGTSRLLRVHGPVLWTGGRFGLEGGVAVTLSTALVVFAMWWWWRSKTRAHGAA